MPSKAFNDFTFSCFDTSFPAVHNGLNVEALLALEGAEREEAARLITDAIPTARDARPIMAAAYLSLVEAIPLLRARLTDGAATPDTRIWTAWSLYRLSRDPAAVAVVLDIVKCTDPDKEFPRWTGSLHALEEFDLTPQVLVALLELAIRVKPNVLLTRTIQEQFGHRRLGPDRWIFNLWQKPRGQMELARRAWRELPEAERRRLENALLEKLIATNSPLIATVLGLLGSPAAAPTIHQLLPTSDAKDRAGYALALYRIDGYADAPAICASLLFSYHEQWVRVAALEALMHMSPTPAIAAALVETIENDRDPVLCRDALVALSELFAGVEKVEAIATEVGAHDYFWPPGSNWPTPSAEMMSTLRVAVEQALASS